MVTTCSTTGDGVMVGLAVALRVELGSDITEGDGEIKDGVFRWLLGTRLALGASRHAVKLVAAHAAAPTMNASTPSRLAVFEMHCRLCMTAF